MIRTSLEMMARGLELAGFDERRQESVRYDENLERFKSYYGSKPIVYAHIWEDLQTTDIAEARIEAKNQKDLDHFFMALCFLTVYKTEKQHGATARPRDSLKRIFSVEQFLWMLMICRRVKCISCVTSFASSSTHSSEIA